MRFPKWAKIFKSDKRFKSSGHKRKGGRDCRDHFLLYIYISQKWPKMAKNTQKRRKNGQIEFCTHFETHINESNAFSHRFVRPFTK